MSLELSLGLIMPEINIESKSSNDNIQTWSIDELIDDYNNHSEKTHSNELKKINLEKYQDFILNENKQKHTYIKKKDKIKILYSDLENYQDECLVNAANELLLGGGGIDGFVHQLGGSELLEEIKAIPLNNLGCRLLEGEAIFSRGYNEKYKKFIHTVPPYYDDNNNMKIDVMKKCFNSIFDIIIKNNIKSVTIPSIGTGFYGFHMLEYTVICFNAISNFLNANPEFDQITLITNSKLQYSYFNIYFNYYLHEES